MQDSNNATGGVSLTYFLNMQWLKRIRCKEIFWLEKEENQVKPAPIKRKEKESKGKGARFQHLTLKLDMSNVEPDPTTDLGKYKPNKDYKHMIVSGAKYWKLSKEYINFLENIQTL